jgi:ribosomal protein L11
VRTVATPPQVPTGTTHLAYVLGEAEEAFKAGRTKDGIANLAHAVHVAVTKREEMDELESRRWFRQITTAAKAWESDA